ncbi:nitroreductase family deazaflavin-dependent oxidoreductase [Phenylobacterium sp. LjRoot225]|uniref:nitroreductase family deazaflavin-dependent oxidoreductase n=1 Tax=Phenylobacterium sp. LjRoot225 TaxID=3342285 RepID=UPI003ECECCE7
MSEQPQAPVYRPADLSLLGPEHVRVYRETNGEQGYIWNGSPILLLTTKGRLSGEPRTIPIIFTPHGDSWVIMGSKGGSPTHPKWYLNILDDPHVQVQVKADIYEAVARTAQSPEREEIWAEAIQNWPNYDVYQSRTERQIPVVVLDPVRKLEPGPKEASK